MREIRLVALDMAGTTVQDDGQVPAAFTAALGEHGIALTPEQVSAVRGASKRQAIAQAWRGTVDAVVCGDEVPRGRPAPYLIFRAMEATGVDSVHHVATVGDTALDLRAGHHAGVRLDVGVLSGAHTRPQLEREPHTHLLPSVAALPGLWPAA